MIVTGGFCLLPFFNKITVGALNPSCPIKKKYTHCIVKISYILAKKMICYL
jgi:hypothetical protein